MLKALTITAAVAAMLAPLAATAQTTPKPVTVEHTQTGTATIVAIDQATRTVTLRYENGDEDTFTIGPAVTRFSQLKKGDTIRATYTESVVFEVRKPGAPAPTQASEGVAAARRREGPGGIVAAVQSATVTVKAVDAATGSITVTTADGHTMRRIIENKKHLEGVKVGDKIDITYSQAVLLNAEPGK